ncbi:MAG TPA: TIGR03086 family metal-binding protein [Streptosporangiaceae bacterium]|jgi:uncharacterized protein (TIGR03086 family)
MRDSVTSQQPAAEDLTASFDRVVTAVGQLVAGVAADQWSAPTPCPAWDVSHLVDHLIAGNRHFAALIQGQPPASQDDPGDRAEAYRISAVALRAAFSAPGALEQVYQSPIGPAPGSAMVQLRISEQLLHGWDLARATGQPPDLPADLAEQALALSLAQLGDAPRDGLPFGPPQPAPGDAPAIDRLAAYFGRPLPA